ncbi:DUF1569 domain-containing protein [Bremerella cremea]|uniref:DUF1569 domain-containing protein n=1 Tax=Bremerella cremea TaxID=1031537 RepID=UPI001F2F3CD1|nr:DUF1569 domain-containing protein [Bremerella cremea]
MTESKLPLRELHFTDLPSAVREAEGLLAGGYTQMGNWTLGQICFHLRVVQDCSIDGYPWYFVLFAPLRPIVRRTLLPRVLKGDSPRGIPTTSIYVPGNDLDDSVEVAAFAESTERLLGHTGSYHPHPGFGRLDRELCEKIYAGHAAHHLRFLRPVG